MRRPVRSLEPAHRITETLFNDAPAAIALLRGRDLTLEFVNSEALALWGRTERSEVLGKPLLVALPEMVGQGFDLLLKGVFDTGQRNCGNETPVTSAGVPGAPRFLNFVCVPTRDSSGTVDGVAVFAFDVTPRVRRARARAELGAHVGRALVTNEPLTVQLEKCCEALVEIGADVARIWTYDATHETLELQSSVGQGAPATVLRVRVPIAASEVGEVARTREAYVTDHAVGDPHVPDQTWVIREGLTTFAGHPLIVGERLVGVMEVFANRAFSADVLLAVASAADQIALGIDRDASERFRELFIGILGHDLRNPLNAVLMGAELLEALPQPPQQLRVITRIQNSGRRMERMIAQVLDFTRARSGGGLPVERTTCDLEQICAQVVDELAGAHADTDVRATYAGDARGSWDADRLAQVFSNLVGNALTHGASGGSVRVSLRADDDTVRFDVLNDDIPIDEALIATLFDPFRRAHHARVAGTRGLGLGLFIAQPIVAAHGGTISVRSSASEGTILSVVLPKVSASA